MATVDAEHVDNSLSLSLYSLFLRKLAGECQVWSFRVPSTWILRPPPPPAFLLLFALVFPAETGENRFGKQSFVGFPFGSLSHHRHYHHPTIAIATPSTPPSVVFSLLRAEASPRAKQPVHPPSHGILIFREVTAVSFLFRLFPSL